jgi:subtilase family serine protease
MTQQFAMSVFAAPLSATALRAADNILVASNSSHTIEQFSATGAWMKAFASLVALCVLTGSLVVAQSPAPVRQELTGHLTEAMKRAPLEGRVPPTTRMTLTVGLVIPNMAELMQTAAQIADPKSPSYRKYLTPEQFADRFGAKDADYQTVLIWAQSNNLRPTAHRNRFVVTVEGAVADIEPALNVHMNYHLRVDGSLFFAPDAEPSVSLSIPVEHIGGLENFTPPVAAGGSGKGGTYQGTDLRNAYAPQITMTGVGQKIGIFMLDGFAQSDIDGYATQTGQSFLPVQIVPTPSSPLTPGSEATIDVESVLSMAPGAQVIAFVGGRTAILTNMTDNQDIKQFTSSWFWYNGTTTDIALMLELATHGQSFFQASGDSGAYAPTNFATYVSGSLDCRQFPAITTVGGTDLHMSDSGADYGSIETAWSKSSGGIMSSVPIPPEQGFIRGQNGASSVNRNVPDVSAQANGVEIFYEGIPQNYWGTSEATPIWAGYMALVNELAAKAGVPSVGYANPAFYSVASSSSYDQNFHDVVSGCAPDSAGVTNCAGTGYDLVTGLGTPTTQLIYTLSGIQAYPLYCKGPLSTSSNSTPFKWAAQGAGAANPGAGECAWADRAPSGTEVKSGDSNTISGDLHQVTNLPAGKYAEIGVFNDPTTHDLVVTQIVGLVTPPFSSKPTLP